MAVVRDDIAGFRSAPLEILLDRGKSVEFFGCRLDCPALWALEIACA
jgi:hypothetical protein